MTTELEKIRQHILSFVPYLQGGGKLTTVELERFAEEIADACITLSKRDGEPVAWIGRSTFNSGEEVDILAATEDGARGLSEERFRSALISPSITTIPLFARPPKEASAKPQVTVDEIMDEVKVWGERYQYDGYLSDLRTRLTKLMGTE